MTKIHTLTDGAYQGDVLIERIDSLPAGLTEVPRTAEGHIVAHSETGHHHAVTEEHTRYYRPATDTGPEAGMVAYLEVLREHADVVHLRAWDTHDTLRLPPGLYRIRRQQERAPEGWARRVED